MVDGSTITHAIYVVDTEGRHHGTGVTLYVYKETIIVNHRPVLQLLRS